MGLLSPSPLALVALPAALVCSACELLVDPGTAQAARCPRTCAVPCSGECLPSGVCTEVARTAAELGLGPTPPGGSWRLSLPGLPPGETVILSIRAGLDATERRLPPPTWLYAWVKDGEGGLALNGNHAAFPVWVSHQAARTVGPDGTLALSFPVSGCRVEGSANCTLTVEPSSTFTATLVNASPWLEAPACE